MNYTETCKPCGPLHMPLKFEWEEQRSGSWVRDHETVIGWGKYPVVWCELDSKGNNIIDAGKVVKLKPDQPDRWLRPCLYCTHVHWPMPWSTQVVHERNYVLHSSCNKLICTRLYSPADTMGTDQKHNELQLHNVINYTSHVHNVLLKNCS